MTFMTGTVEVPQYHELLWPALQAVSELGGSASIGEMVETVVKREGFTDEQQSVLHNDGPETEIGYRLAWARTYLKGMGLLTNSARGVWAPTDDAVSLLTEPSWSDEDKRKQVRERWSAYVVEMRKKDRKKKPPKDDEGQPAEDPSWKEQLVDRLMQMPPDAFERLAKRLLREADFGSVNVTGRSGDGGIDGLGVYRLGLVSFPVFFQCKRYRGSVRPGAVRDFRGAMSGRGDKGLLITTGTFTADANVRPHGTAHRPSTSSTATASSNSSRCTNSASRRRCVPRRTCPSSRGSLPTSDKDVRLEAAGSPEVLPSPRESQCHLRPTSLLALSQAEPWLPLARRMPAWR